MWKAAPGALIVVVALMLARAGQASAQEPLSAQLRMYAESLGLHGRGTAPPVRLARIGIT